METVRAQLLRSSVGYEGTHGRCAMQIVDAASCFVFVDLALEVFHLTQPERAFLFSRQEQMKELSRHKSLQGKL